MDLGILKKKISTFKIRSGTLTKVSDELLIEILYARENWTGPASGFYAAIGADHLIRIQNIKGEKFTDIEIEQCGNENKIDFCYERIITDNKNYFFDVLNKSPKKTECVAIIGHNGDYFSVKKGEVVNVEKNVAEKFGAPIAEQENRNTSMVLLNKYEYKSEFCREDSEGPVFDYLTGDLARGGPFASAKKEVLSINMPLIQKKFIHSSIAIQNLRKLKFLVSVSMSNHRLP